jgi:hypothetical protein
MNQAVYTTVLPMPQPYLNGPRILALVHSA